MDKIRIICRNSRLSLIQAEIVKTAIHRFFPACHIEIRGKTSVGDRESNRPLSSFTEMDIFTQDIYQELHNGNADIAVHSLKDMSSEHFFSHDSFAVVDRQDPHDVVIFTDDIITKLKTGKTIILGTSSPRREEMAVKFLRRALPQLHQNIDIKTSGIRGNVDTRLKKLNNKEYDGIILAASGLNRLLEFGDQNHEMSALLDDKKIMILPLIECTPAPCQGMIVAEGNPSNEKIYNLLKIISKENLLQEAREEKIIAKKYGAGCSQKFGVTTIHSNTTTHIYAAGKDESGMSFQEWTNLPNIVHTDKKIFATNEVMKDFFDYQWIEDTQEIQTKHVFVANPKIAQNQDIINTLGDKYVWAAGSKTWSDLAKSGVWVSGSTDGMGFKNLAPILAMPLVKTSLDEVTILTHLDGASRWKEKGKKSIGFYQLIPQHLTVIEESIQEANIIFWTSFAQYKTYQKYAKTKAIHCCAGGETATLIKQSGIEPIIFPTIKAFEIWRTNIK